MNRLARFKILLANRAVDVYVNSRDTLEFTEYKNHFMDMGATLSRIDQYTEVSDILKDLLKGDFDYIGLISGDVMLEEFLEKAFQK